MPRPIPLLFLAPLLVVACGTDEQAPAASGPGAAEAQTIWQSRCTTCHGPSGAGDGAAAAGLNPRPRNLQDDAWQSSVNDEHIERIIVGGGAAVGKSPLMPPNPDLQNKADVVTALREHVRGLAP